MSVCRLQLHRIVFRSLVALLMSLAPARAEETRSSRPIVLDRTVVVAPASLSPRERQAVTMLIEEVEKRSGIRWKVVEKDVPGAPVIVVGRASSLERISPSVDHTLQIKATPGAEGYRIGISQDEHAISVIGNDERGVLFGVGRLLRELRLHQGRVVLDRSFQVSTAPAIRLRGHQLGYRPKTNSYDAWDLPQWEQYIRDLAVFGTNAIELVPPRTDDTPDSPHFPRPQMEMMIGMSRIADAYGLDVWVWYPAMDSDYANPATVEAAIKEWASVLKQLPRLDAILVPGGDPGHTQPKYLMALLEKQTESIKRFHPNVQMWMSPQGFDEKWFDEFLEIMKTEPAWLTGVVFGPQVRMRLPELRKAIPRKYPIRLYPDITHCLNCQYPVPEWDVAYSLTHERESINPRPLGQAAILRATQGDSIGFLSYSEGCNDDINKFVWSGLGWNPETPEVEILRDYGRYFIDDRMGDAIAQGILALESNWRGPLLTNTSVETTLQQFQALERQASPRDLLNWRFQHLLYRAYYDAYIRNRLIRETQLESEAMQVLREAEKLGALAAIARAENLLREPLLRPSSSARRSRIYELAEAMYQSIRMQTSVEKYLGVPGRGTSLDTLEIALNNREWLEARFAEIRQIKDEPARLEAIHDVVHRTDPGPGGFYDDLGDLAHQPHLVKNEFRFDEDPDFRRTAVNGFDYLPNAAWPIAWTATAQTLYTTPLKMQYDGLDPRAQYKIKVVYGPDNFRPKIKMDADGTQIHDYMLKPNPPRPIEFDIPSALTKDGRLSISWTQEPGRGGNGRGCQVAEVWLIRK